MLSIWGLGVGVWVVIHSGSYNGSVGTILGSGAGAARDEGEHTVSISGCGSYRRGAEELWRALPRHAGRDPSSSLP